MMSDEEQLLQMHQQMIQAHLDKDVTGWAELETAVNYTVASRGEIHHPTPEERAARRTPYLQATEFSEYRDLEPPIVKVSEDGTLGWLVCQVQASGTQTGSDGEQVEFTFISAWVELYEKQNGRWLCTGNVSNFKPQ